MTRTADILIIGGGIVGCACAYELSKRGAKVTLVEYGKTGMQATNAAAGILAPLGESHAPGAMLDAGVRALRAYPALVDELQAACGFDLELKQDGILRVALDDEHEERLRRAYAWQREMGFDVQWLDGAASREIEPRLSQGVVAGLLSPAEGSVSNQMIALALERAAEARGAEILQRHPVTRAKRSKGRVIAVEAGDETFSADTIVLAAGARSGQIARKFGITLPVFPVRGQMLALGGMSQPIGRVVWDSSGYLVPRANGLVFAGATVEKVGFRRRTTSAGIRAMRSMANRLVPQLSAATVHFTWAGLRPGTPDGLPFVGPMPGTNIVAATGHYRNGILLGPITGSWVATGVVDADWSATPREFRYERLAA